MKNMLNSIDYVVECRDYRVPVTSINPMFEEALGHTRRLIVYTKRDLGADQLSARKQVSQVAHSRFYGQSLQFFPADRKYDPGL